MRVKSKLILAASLALALLPASAANAAPPASDQLNKVLAELDAAARNFHSTSADFQFDTVQTDPVPDTETQKGTVYYERKGSAFEMAAHIREENGKPSPKMYSYSGGALKLFEPQINQVTSFNRAGQFESYVMLGFGASGKELQQKWDIKYVGPETLHLREDNSNVKTEELELVAKDPTVRRNLPKVTIWVDTTRGISLKQVFDEGPSGHRVCVYFNFKVNQNLPADAFTIKTNKQTTYLNR